MVEVLRFIGAIGLQVLIPWAFGQFTERVKQGVNNYKKIGFYEEQRDWEFNDSYDFWRSFEGPQHWSSAKIHEIKEKKRSERFFTDKITLHMHFSNFVPTLPGWNAYKEFSSLWIEESGGRKSSACEGIKINSLIPALGYNMIRPPILSQKKRPSKKEHLYLSAFRRIVPDGILVYLESEVINDQRFQKIIDILNEFGSVDMRLKGIPEQVKNLSDPNDKFFTPFISKFKGEGIGIPNLAWGRIRVESPDDIYWNTVNRPEKLEGAGSVWNAIELDDDLCFFQKSIHLGVDYYKIMFTQAAEDIECEIAKYGDYQPLFAIDAYSKIFDNAKLIPWKTNERYDLDFMLEKESFSAEKIGLNKIEMDSEFIVASHMSYIKGFKKEVQLYMAEAIERQNEKDYEKAKYLLSEAEKLINIAWERIENENLMSNEFEWFRKRKTELKARRQTVEEWCT